MARHYLGTGVTEKVGIESNRPLGAIVFGTDNLVGMTNESIRVYLEGGNAAGEDIIKTIKLLPVMLLEQYGDGEIFALPGGTMHYSLISITTGGAYPLKNNEFIKVDLKGLNAAKNYSIDSFEVPNVAKGVVQYEFYPILDQLDSARVDCRGRQYVFIEGLSHISKIRREFAKAIGSPDRDIDALGLRVLENENNNITVVNGDNTAEYFTSSNGVVMDVSAIDFLHIEKTAGQNVNMYFKSTRAI